MTALIRQFTRIRSRNRPKSILRSKTSGAGFQENANVCRLLREDLLMDKRQKVKRDFRQYKQALTARSLNHTTR